MAFQQTPITRRTRLSPYDLPPEQQGWRGMEVPGLNAKRRAYTIFWNEQVLVMALLTIPGERNFRHSHESGEVSISFADALHPTVTYNPGGWVHGGLRTQAPPPDSIEAVDELLKSVGSPEVEGLLHRILDEQKELRRAVEELKAPIPGPHMGVELLFPPFRTTIDDPDYPETRTIVGPWYD